MGIGWFVKCKEENDKLETATGGMDMTSSESVELNKSYDGDGTAINVNGPLLSSPTS